MSTFVVDANVAIKWVLPEIHSPAALRLKRIDYTFSYRISSEYNTWTKLSCSSR